MPFIRVIPKNSGGGGWRSEPAATLYQSGQLTLSVAAVEMLGDPDRVHLDVDPVGERIRLTPSTPDDSGAFSLSGGGNTPARIGCRDAARRYPQMIGKYSVHKLAGGVELRKVKADGQ